MAVLRFRCCVSHCLGERAPSAEICCDVHRPKIRKPLITTLSIRFSDLRFIPAKDPRLDADANFANTMLLAGRYLGGEVNYYGVRASLYPIVEDLELKLYEDPERRQEIVELFEKMVLPCRHPE